MDIVEVDVDRLDPQLRASWHRAAVAISRTDAPEDPEPTVEQAGANLVPDPFGRLRAWLARDGDVIGLATARLADPNDNPHLCELAVQVHPQWRRRGVGRALADVAMDAARADGRTTADSYVETDAGRGFAQRLGARKVHAAYRNLLLLAEAKLEPTRADGYRLAAWTDRTPDGLVDRLAVAKESMRDAPTGEMDMQPWSWDATRVRRLEDIVVRRLRAVLLTIAAIHEDSGDVAGLTEVVVWPAPAVRAHQWDTVVVPAHRGHGLGLALKSAMVERLRAEAPGVSEVQTFNAVDNAPMLAVNERLGFRPVATEDVWQTPLG